MRKKVGEIFKKKLGECEGKSLVCFVKICHRYCSVEFPPAQMEKQSGGDRNGAALLPGPQTRCFFRSILVRGAVTDSAGAPALLPEGLVWWGEGAAGVGGGGLVRGGC